MLTWNFIWFRILMWNIVSNTHTSVWIKPKIKWILTQLLGKEKCQQQNRLSLWGNVTYVNDIISYIPWYQIDKSTLFDNCVKKKGL